MLAFVLCGLLFSAGATRAAPAPADGDEAKVADYLKALKSKNAAVRKQVALALGDLGEKAKSATPALRQALLDADEGVQAAAAAALEKINGTAKVSGDAAAELRKLREELDVARKRAEEETARARQAAEESRKRAEEEAVRARDLARAAEAARAEADKARVDLRDKAVAAEIATKNALERNKELLQKIEELTKENARLRKEQAPPRDIPKRVPADVEGVIKDVDAKSGLVTITIGSDAGLQKGQKLEVYRLKPAPKYLGQIEIIDTTATRSVGKPVGEMKDPVQKGDSVGSGVSPKK
jgi:hypothetical protein